MAKLDFHIHSDCTMDTQAEATEEAIRRLAVDAEEFFHRDFSGEDNREAAGFNMLRTYIELGKQIALSIEGIVTPVELE